MSDKLVEVVQIEGEPATLSPGELENVFGGFPIAFAQVGPQEAVGTTPGHVKARRHGYRYSRLTREAGEFRIRASSPVRAAWMLSWRVEATMPLVDTRQLKVTERLPGWHGRYFHAASMTFAHYEFERGSSIHEHRHPQEEVYEVLEGVLEITIDCAVFNAEPGIAAIVPASALHSVRALTDGRVIIVDSPSRPEIG